jgi:hypothetical protein
MQLIVLVTPSGIVLSKPRQEPDHDPLRHWPCHTYFGPMPQGDVTHFLSECYPTLRASIGSQVRAFAASAEVTRRLSLLGSTRSRAA